MFLDAGIRPHSCAEAHVSALVIDGGGVLQQQTLWHNKLHTTLSLFVHAETGPKHMSSGV